MRCSSSRGVRGAAVTLFNVVFRDVSYLKEATLTHEFWLPGAPALLGLDLGKLKERFGPPIREGESGMAYACDDVGYNEIAFRSVQGKVREVIVFHHIDG